MPDCPPGCRVNFNIFYILPLGWLPRDHETFQLLHMRRRCFSATSVFEVKVRRKEMIVSDRVVAV